MSHTQEERYQLILTAAATAPKNRLIQTAAKLLEVDSTHTVRTIIRRLQARGYDLSAWYEASGRPHTGRNVVSDDVRYSQFMQAAMTAKPGQLTQTAMRLTGLSEAGMRKIRKRLKVEGYDLSDWDVAAELSQLAGQRNGGCIKNQITTAPPASYSPPKASPQPWSNVRPAAINMPEHVRARRDQWYSDMMQVSGRAGAIGLLCQRWNCEASTAKGRIHSLRSTGYDLSWWNAGQTRAMQPCEQPLNELIQASKVEPLPLPVVEAPRPQKRQIWAADVPYTMQSIADIVGVPVMAVRFAARAHGIGFDRWCLAPDVALGLLAALGFIRTAAA